jgi:hypothetical protein
MVARSTFARGQADAERSYSQMKPIVPLTPEQKAALEQMLYGRASRLLVPMSLLEPSNTQPIGFPDGSQSLVPPTYADVSGNASSAGDLSIRSSPSTSWPVSTCFWIGWVRTPHSNRQPSSDTYARSFEVPRELSLQHHGRTMNTS